MRSARPIHTRIELLSLEIISWARQRLWLRTLYRFVPFWLRHPISVRLATRRLSSVAFPSMPAASDKKLASGMVSVKPAVDYPAFAGVNIFGYLRGQFGLAESARMYACALLDAGYPVALIDVDLGLQHGMGDSSLEPYMGTEAPYATNLIFVNPDYFQQAMQAIGASRLEGRRTIACWFWELPEIPKEWLWAINAVDEIMVASQFVADAFRRVTDKPILLVQLPISKIEDSGLTREDLGLPLGKFIFLTTFDFHSSIHRKNPSACMRAFQEAFPRERDDVRLLVKSSNGYLHPDQMQELMSLSLNDPRIILRDEIIDRAHVSALQRCCDAYVSLHRAEGFGLGLAESMAMGKPVIGTEWSGNLDFMTAQNSCLVGFELVPVLEGQYPHASGLQWAEANVAHAATWMRKIADDDAFRSEIARRAAADIARNLSPAVAANRLAEHIDQSSQMRASNRCSGAAPFPRSEGSRC